MKFSFTCSCGDKIEADAKDRNEAIGKIKEMMNKEMVEKHMSEKHPNQPVPAMDQVAMMIVQGVQQV